MKIREVTLEMQSDETSPLQNTTYNDAKTHSQNPLHEPKNMSSIFEKIRKAAFLKTKTKHTVKELESIYRNKDKLKIDENRLGDCEYLSELKEIIIDKLITEGLDEFKAYPVQILFLASIKCDVDHLTKIIKKFKVEQIENGINDCREFDNALTFTLKCGRFSMVTQNDFFRCLHLLIVDFKIDVNRCDFSGKYPLDTVTVLYRKKHIFTDSEMTQDLFKKTVDLIVDNGGGLGAIDDDNKIFIEKELHFLLPECKEIQTEVKLFNLIKTQKNEEFKALLKGSAHLKDIDDGEYTLIQLICRKQTKSTTMIDFMLKLQVDTNKVTDLRWDSSPLEICAIYKNFSGFTMILNHEKTTIDEELFKRLLRPKIPRRCVKEILNCDKIRVDYKSKLGLSPLYYALSYSYIDVAKKLIKRGASFIESDNGKKRPLDIISINNLEKCFNSCIILDTHNDFGANEYKIQLDLNIFTNANDELEFVKELGESKDFQQILTHPLVHSYLDLKWKACEKYFAFTVAIQSFILGSLYLVFLYNDFCGIFPQTVMVFINFLVKTAVFYMTYEGYHKYKYKNLQLWTEILSMCTMFAIILTHCIPVISDIYEKQFRAFIFIQMTICFLLTIGYHPKLSKWSVMIQKVFKTFSILALFFFLPILSFAIAFQIFFSEKDDNNPDNKSLHLFLPTSILKVFAMITSEFDIDDVKFTLPGSYLIFFIFIVTMSMIVTNFWTGVAVSDIETIRKNSELNSFKNLLHFLSFADKLNSSPIIRLYLGSTNLFSNDKAERRVDLYVNKNEINVNGAIKKLDEECLAKIKNYIDNENTGVDTLLLGKLEEIKKLETMLLKKFEEIERKFHRIEKDLKN